VLGAGRGLCHSTITYTIDTSELISFFSETQNQSVVAFICKQAYLYIQSVRVNEVGEKEDKCRENQTV